MKRKVFELRRLLGTAGCARAAALQFARRGSAILISADAKSSGPSWVAKEVEDPYQLARVLTCLRDRRPALSRQFPKVVACHGRWAVLEYVPGRSVFEAMLTSLKRDEHAEDVDVHVRGTAQAMAALSGLDAPALGVSGTVRTHRSFAGSLETLWAQPVFRVWLSGRHRDPAVLLGRFSSAFLASECRDVTLGDCRPKNTVIPFNSPLCFIDLQFLVGSPAHMAAAWIVALDRVASGYINPSSVRRVRHWQQTFADTFLRLAPQHAEGLEFFYAWVLLQMMSQHAAEHPWLKVYLTHYYARRLNRFLGGVEGAAHEEDALPQVAHGIASGEWSPR